MWDSYYYISGEQGIIVLGLELSAAEGIEIEGVGGGIEIFVSDDTIDIEICG
jgi:hypothetical protein